MYKIALLTRKISHMVGAPTLLNSKMMTRHKIIQNCPVTVEDIEIAEKIFGPDIYTLKVRTTRQWTILLKYQENWLRIISS